MAYFCVAQWNKSSELSPWTHVKSVPSVKVTINARVANRPLSQTVTVSPSVCMFMYACVECETQADWADDDTVR